MNFDSAQQTRTAAPLALPRSTPRCSPSPSQSAESSRTAWHTVPQVRFDPRVAPFPPTIWHSAIPTPEFLARRQCSRAPTSSPALPPASDWCAWARSLWSRRDLSLPLLSANPAGQSLCGLPTPQRDAALPVLPRRPRLAAHPRVPPTGRPSRFSSTSPAPKGRGFSSIWQRSYSACQPAISAPLLRRGRPRKVPPPSFLGGAGAP